MGYRGRLIWPVMAKIQQLDTAATKANTGTQPSGYDRIFREPVKFESGGDSRIYRDPIMLPCQYRDRNRGPYEELEQFSDGRVLRYKLLVILHYQDLESRGLVDSKGRTVFQVSDKLLSLHEQDGSLIREYDETPLFCVHLQDRSFGLSGLKRNLVMLYFDDRDTASA